MIYLKDVNAMKRLPAGYHARISDSLTGELRKKYGESNVKSCGKSIEKLLISWKIRHFSECDDTNLIRKPRKCARPPGCFWLKIIKYIGNFLLLIRVQMPVGAKCDINAFMS